MTRTPNHLKPRRVILCCLFLAGIFSCLQAYAQDDVEADLEYIAGLNELGFPDYAERVLERIRQHHDESVVQRAELKILGAQGKLDEAQALIDKRPDRDSAATWRLRLELAELYYAWGQAPKFFEIYGQFIDKYGANPPESMHAFVVEKVYRYSQFLLIMGQDKKAADALRVVHAAAKEDHVKRQMGIELAELLVGVGEKDKALRKAAFAEAEKLAKDVQWGAVDIWFGRSVVVLAHIRVVEKDREGARKLVMDYMGELQAIHQALKDEAERVENDDLLRLTPLAQCRYILGVMMHDEALELLEKADEAADPREADALQKEALARLIGGVSNGKRDKNAALPHLYNVFVRYATTQWAVDAGKRANDIIALLEEMGVQVGIPAVDMTEVVNTQFREARSQFQQNDFEGAIEKYLDVLNLFPEYEASVDALGELAKCYVELDRHIEARMVVEYLADRFTADEQMMLKSGDIIARIARAYSELDMKERADELNEFFYRRFPRHPQVQISIFRTGEDYFQDEQYDKALEYYLRLIPEAEDERPPNYLDALYRTALCYSKLEEFGDALKIYSRYLQALKDDPRQSVMDVIFRMADIYRKSGRYDIASARYHQIVKTLTGPDREKYEISTSEKEKNDQILEGALFYRADATAKRMKPPNPIPEGRPADPEYWQTLYKRLAIKYFEEFREKMEGSDIIPNVLARLGALYMATGDVDKAQDALNRLQRDYGGTEQALRSLFQYARTLLDLGREREATEAFKQMFEGEIQYPPSQVMEAGREIYTAGEHQIALDAFKSALARTDDPALIQKGLLWKGRAEVALKQYADAAASIEQLFQKYPRTAYTIDAAFLLGGAHAALGEKTAPGPAREKHYDKAYKAIGLVYKYTAQMQDDVGRELRARADIELANIQMRSGEKGKALGSYMRSWMLLKPHDSAHRKYKEMAYSKAMPLVAETERWDEVEQASALYLKLYGDRGTFSREAERWLTEAKIKQAGTRGAPEPEPDTTVEPAPEENALPELVPDEAPDEALDEALAPAVGGES